MADDIIASGSGSTVPQSEGGEHSSAAPVKDAARAAHAIPLDTVLAWLTPTVEHDYIARNVFSSMRAGAVVRVLNSGRSLHHLTPATAAEVLADAQAQHGKALSQRGLKASYASLIGNLKDEIERSEKRVARAAASTATCISACQYTEYWCGSRRQLEASDFAIEGALPGEEGSTRKRASIRDKRGYDAVVELVSAHWPDFYQVTVRLPEEHREHLKRVEQAEMERRAVELAVNAAPATQAAFREAMSKRFWGWVNYTLHDLQDGLGYRLSESSIEEFKDAASEAFYAIKEGEVVGESLKARFAAVQRENARKDESLQRFLTSCQATASGEH